MLNYNTIKSSINAGDSKNLELIRFMGISQSTFYDKLKRKSLTPNELEKLAEYFKKPIAYFFDKEEKESPDVAQEGNDGYKIKRIDCLECIGKQKEIDALKSAIDAKDELLEMYRGKKGRECG